MSLANLRFANAQEEKAAKNPQSKLSSEVITGKEALTISPYLPEDKDKEIIAMVRRQFQLGDLNMRKPRLEFNDMSLLVRSQLDRMGFNSYQVNDGDPLEGNEATAWKSNAQRPIIRNKVISIAAHATARLLWPKVFAHDDNNEVQHEAALVMEDLMDWSGNQSNYSKTGLYATLQALFDPASIVYTDYCETYRSVKKVQDNGSWKWELECDEELSGFQDVVVPVDELYIENFYEPDIQKQGFLIWRRVHNYSLMEAKYKTLPNFKYVKPGIQLLYDDANRLFYEVYDYTMRPEMCEEIIYWNRTLDLKLILVNGVLLTDCENPNPRNDKKYPFAKFGYELIHPNFFYYKSLAFKMIQDAKVINTLYQMVMDGTYLQLFPPMVNQGGETVGSDVLIPGITVNLSDPNATIKPLVTSNNIGAGINAMFQVEKSINETSADQYMQGGQVTRKETAYALSIMQQNANTLLGLFVQMISMFVRDFGKLRMGDIVQYMTIADVTKMEGAELVFKAFFLHNKQSNGKNVTRKIQFDNTLPTDKMDEAGKLKLSYDTLDKQGGVKSNTELHRVNPGLFRDLKFLLVNNPDIQSPMSEEMEREFGIAEFDRMIAQPMVFDPKETGRLLLEQYPRTKKDPDKFLAKQAQQMAMNPANPMQALQGNKVMAGMQTPQPPSVQKITP